MRGTIGGSPAIGSQVWEISLHALLVAGVPIVLLVILYRLKRQFGSQHWRWRGPQAVMKGVSGALGFVARTVPWKPILVWGPWVAMLGGFAFYQVENWRGARAWKQVEEQIRSRGEALSLPELLVEPPSDQNIAEHPVLRSYLRSGRVVPTLDSMSLPGLRTNVEVSLDPVAAETTEMRDWFVDPPPAELGDEELARRILELAEGPWADLDGLAEGLRRPHCKVEYSYDRFGLPREARAFRQVSFKLAEAYQERAFLYARAGQGSACAADLESLLHVANRLHGVPLLMGHVIRLGILAVHSGLLWEALRLQVLDEEELLAVDRALAEIDLAEGMGRVLQAERAVLLRIIEGGKGRRGELVEEFGLEFDWSDDWDENLRRAREQAEVRFGPTGWFDQQKVAASRGLTMWIGLLAEGDRIAIRREVARASEASYPDPPRGLDLFQGYGPAVGMSLARTLRLETILGIERVAIAAERYRLREGHYPPDREALVPDFLAEWPDDGRSGDPLRYQRKADGTPWIRGTAIGRRRRSGSRPDGWEYTVAPDEEPAR